MILIYATALILVIVLPLHLVFVSPLTGKPFEDTLSYSFALHNLTAYQIAFGILLYAAAIHGFLGLRAILIEWLHPDKLGERAINAVIIVLMIIVLAVGTYTLVVL